MIRSLKDHWEKYLLIVAAFSLALSAGWSWQQTAVVRRIRAQPVKVQLTGAAYQSAPRRRADLSVGVWPKPLEQPAGNGWLYEVFTPPMVYYNTKTRSFTVERTHGPTGGASAFGLELVGVKPEMYRLQLTGCFGGPGNFLGAFAEPDRSEILLAREGRRFENLGLTLKSLAVGKVPVESGEAWPACDIAAIAVLYDESAGKDVVLDSRTHQLTGRFLALVRFQPGDDRVHELHEGDTISDANSIYRIDRIGLDPVEVAVVRQSPGLQDPENKILRPASKISVLANGRPVIPGPPSAHPPSGLATNVK